MALELHLPIALSTLEIVLIVFCSLVVLFFIGGLLGALSRDRRRAGSYAEHVAAADAALEQARAADLGWDREVMETAAREALEGSRPGWSYEELHLVLVDDRPGVAEDRAQFVAVAGDDEARIFLGRQGERWAAERVE